MGWPDVTILAMSTIEVEPRSRGLTSNLHLSIFIDNSISVQLLNLVKWFTKCVGSSESILYTVLGIRFDRLVLWSWWQRNQSFQRYRFIQSLRLVFIPVWYATHFTNSYHEHPTDRCISGIWKYSVLTWDLQTGNLMWFFYVLWKLYNFLMFIHFRYSKVDFRTSWFFASS